jgi:GT2 family glycosyltransferase
MSFCIRATTAGFPIYVHTGIQTQHAKHTYLSHEMYQTQLGQPQPPVPTYAIIPVKDEWPMTRDLLAQLSGHVDGVFVYDNGSSSETKARLREQSIAEVFPADGLGIHEMWQAGVEEARERSPKCNLLILNNDIRLGDGAVEAMASALRSNQTLAAVCPNYDGRPGEGIEKLHSICANRYDGTGGLAGFAFMVKGEFFDSFSFPLDAMWWYGDNLLTLAIDAQGGWYGMAHDATVEHLDGGGKTGDWDAYAASEQHTRDLEAFKKAAEELGIGVQFEAAS